MFCPSCGKQIPDDSTFCEFCGTRRDSLQAVPAAVPMQAPSGAIPQQLDREQLGKILWKSMTLGEKFIALGAAAGILGFFLPWGSIPNVANLNLPQILNGGSPFNPGEANRVYGFDIARMWGGFYLVLFGAVAAAILFYVAGKSPNRKKLTINAFQVLIGSLAGPQMLFLVLLTPMAQEGAGLGWWLTCFGYCAIAAGGIISISHLGKQLA